MENKKPMELVGENNWAEYAAEQATYDAEIASRSEEWIDGK